MSQLNPPTATRISKQPGLNDLTTDLDFVDEGSIELAVGQSAVVLDEGQRLQLIIALGGMTPHYPATEAEAMALVHGIRGRFGWVGTEFCLGDVRDAIRESDGGPEDTEVEAVLDRVIDDPRWHNLGDILSERGNETISDLVADLLPDADDAVTD